MPASPFDILVAGEINPDLILTGNVQPRFHQVEQVVDSATLTIGSSSAIFACGAARLGLRTAFIGVCGPDVFGHFMLAEMQKRQVDVSNVLLDPAQQTGLSVILNLVHDRAILTHTGALDQLRADQVTDDLLRQARHLHVASYFLQHNLRPGLPDLFRRARTLGLTTSLDTNWDPAGGWLGLDELLSLTSVFLPNENEALALTGAPSVEQAAAALCQTCETVAVKRGADGALACRLGETAAAPALNVDVVDTVGAGDSFDGGFLYGYLHGWSLEKSLKLGAACGSISTTSPGGTTGQATLEQAMHWV